MISENDLAEFEVAIAVACAHKSPAPFRGAPPPVTDATPVTLPDRFRDGAGAIVISFDARWHPFLNNGVGHHVGELPRWYLPQNPLLDAVCTALKNPDELRRAGASGGRVFLHAAGVRRRLAGEMEREVLTWQLPRHSALLR